MEVDVGFDHFDEDVKRYKGVLEEMLHEMKTQKHSLQQRDRHLQEQRDLVTLYLQQRDEARFQVKELETKKQLELENAFVVMLVDGDHMLFLDTFVNRGLEGGRDAARTLKRAVIEFFNNDARNIYKGSKIVLRAYARCDGLERHINSGKEPGQSVDLQEFVRGFNQGIALFDFIDVGVGKERTDTKLRETFKLFIDNMYCQNIILAASGDGGYARLLEEYIDDDAKRRKITMIEGPPFVPELVEVSKYFYCGSFPEVFKSERSSKHKSSSRKTPPVTPPATYAKLVGNEQSGKSKTPKQKTPPSSTHFKILRNKQGQRVDERVIFSPTVEMKLAKQNLCHQYHLLGQCVFSKCNFAATHKAPVKDDEWRALRNLARRSRCPRGLNCSERNCVLGHQCTKNCVSSKASCRFPESMHDIDTEAATEE